MVHLIRTETLWPHLELACSSMRKQTNKLHGLPVELMAGTLAPLSNIAVASTVMSPPPIVLVLPIMLPIFQPLFLSRKPALKITSVNQFPISLLCLMIGSLLLHLFSPLLALILPMLSVPLLPSSTMPCPCHHLLSPTLNRFPTQHPNHHLLHTMPQMLLKGHFVTTD